MFEVRACAGADEYARAIGAIGQYFNPPPSEEFFERFVETLPHERMHAAFDGEQIVGGAGAFPFELSVPGGGSLPCGGVTAVGVHPTHRRRGVLRSMMDAQLRDVHERGEPIAALWASEETIYGRFGYGIASWAGELRVPHEWDAFAEPLELAGTTRFVTPEEAFELFPPMYDAVRRSRPGMTSRSEAWWKSRHLRLPEEESAAPRRFVVLEIDGAPQAYARYRTHFGFDGGSATSRLVVGEALGATPRATASIWRFLLDIDWMGTVEVQLAPPDHPLFLLLAAPRRARYRMGDGLWVRLVDLPAALSGRSYSEGGSLVLEVRDAICDWNDGRWRLEGGTCERTDEEPDLALDVSALGSAYLGAVSFTQLRDALRVEELQEGAVARADALFAWRPLPWCLEIF
ncbi:MAG TPA: GNAT family N-acetyltransferase [Gaiellaceae bacterium]|nr:GNAT family N-acetyltransferase [Gaiellaceae bacterium]